ncbi:MAG TPA: PilZ domain-containing protein [Bradyrhizobium sp.]|jgi:PilZ domain|nr:PilZ domain-containing protein [Bradyrhizobium sp.]
MVEAAERRIGQRIRFDHMRPARMMGLDGTWQRECTIDDVSDRGARLTIDDSIEGLPLQEFFLVLSSTGLVYRRCRLVWVNGDQIGVAFLGRSKTKPSVAK